MHLEFVPVGALQFVCLPAVCGCRSHLGGMGRCIQVVESPFHLRQRKSLDYG